MVVRTTNGVIPVRKKGNGTRTTINIITTIPSHLQPVTRTRAVSWLTNSCQLVIS